MKLRVFTISILAISLISCVSAQIKVNYLNKKNVTLQEIQNAIEYNLDNIKMKKSNSYIIYRINDNKQRYFYNYFSVASKKRIMELLNGEWREEELQFLTQKSMSSSRDTLNKRNFFYKKAKDIAVQKQKPFSVVWDSMLLDKKRIIYNNIKSNKYVPLSVIKIAAYLKDDAFLPYLLKLNEGKMRGEKTLQLVLARYGIEPYTSEMLKKYSFKSEFFNAKKLMFICNKVAVQELYDAILNDDSSVCDTGGECFEFYAQSYLEILQTLLKNNFLDNEISKVREEFYSNTNATLSIELINKMRDVLIKNNDLIFNSDIDCEASYLGVW